MNQLDQLNGRLSFDLVATPDEAAMATEKLAEGIRAFAADAGKLDQMIEALRA